SKNSGRGIPFGLSINAIPLSVFMSCTFTPASLAQARRSVLHFIEWIGPSPSRKTCSLLPKTFLSAQVLDLLNLL
uniref:Uncharacterized protein n=1 Tax=Oryza brachyantha TaxID=4533 RepID=J3NCL9_ORYBR